MSENVIELPRVQAIEWGVVGIPAWTPSDDGPVVRCNCGSWSGIQGHHVHADGRVTPSFYHKRGNNYPEDPKGCEWHVFIRLADYDCGEFPPRKKDG